MDLFLDILASGPAFVASTIASIVASVLFALAIGQPLILEPTTRRWLDTHWLLLGVICLASYAVSLFCKHLQRRRASRHDDPEPPGPRAQAGHHGTAIAAQNSTVNARHISDSYNTTVHGVTDELRRNRNRPRDVQSTMRAVGDFVNAGDPYWERTFGSDGSFCLTPRTPDAHVHAPLRVELQTRTSSGEPTLLELLQHALEDQQPLTVNDEMITRFQSFLGQEIMEDSAEHPDARMTLSIRAQPMAPPKRCILRVPETGTAIGNLNLALYMLPSSQLRFTNRQDQDAPIWLTIDLDRPTTQAIAALEPDDPVLHRDTGMTISLMSRPVSGRTARHLLAVYDLVRVLQTSRRVEIVDDSTGTVDITFDCYLPGQALTPDEDHFVNVLRTVQDAFPLAAFDMSGTPSRDDVAELERIAAVVTTGVATYRISSLSTRLTVEFVRMLLTHANVDSLVQLRDSNGQEARLVLTAEQERISLFGTTIDLGPSSAELCPLRLTSRLAMMK